MTAAFVTRFAPSPTGYLHLGHAFSALTAQAAAQQAGGRFLLRIEDIDRTRCRPEFEAAIYEDLGWLGLTWEQPVRRQSEHLADFGAALAGLSERGLTYRCFRTRREVAEAIESAPHGARWRCSAARPCRRTRSRGGSAPASPMPGGCRSTRPSGRWAGSTP